MMGADYGAVDHLHRLQNGATARECVQQRVEYARLYRMPHPVMPLTHERGLKY